MDWKFPCLTTQEGWQEIPTCTKPSDANVLIALPLVNASISTTGYMWFICDGCYFVPTLDLTTRMEQTRCFASKDQLNGTLFAGIRVKSHVDAKTCYFFLEDVHYYQHQLWSHHSFHDKLKLWHQLFTDEHRLVHVGSDESDKVKSDVIFGLPFMTDKWEELQFGIQNRSLPYEVGDIKFRYWNARKVFCMKWIRPYRIWRVTACVQPDIYYLTNPTSELPLAAASLPLVALIPDYKTSVMMNRLFRNMKENDNLDAMEESDDEQEFQQRSNPSNHVFLDRSYLMKCVFQSRHHRWCPLEVVLEGCI